MPKEKKVFSPDHFRENLRELMWQRNINQTDLSRMMDVPTSSICNWLHGRSEPNLYSFTKMCNVLDVPPEWFLTKNRYVNFK